MTTNETTNEELTALVESLPHCSDTVKRLFNRLVRVEGERDDWKKGFDQLAEEIGTLRQRISDLTQCDPGWYDASPADAFMLLKKAHEEIKRLRDGCTLAGVQKLIADIETFASKNTALQERVKKLELALQHIAQDCSDPQCTCSHTDTFVAQAALKEGE